MARHFTKYPSNYVKASGTEGDDTSWKVVEGIKHALFDGDDMIYNFVTFAGDGHSFIVTDGTDEFRVTVSKEV